MSFDMWWSWSVAALVASMCISCGCAPASELEDQVKVLSKQVTALLDKRKEDLRSIEDNMRRKLYDGPEITDVKDELQNLRSEIEQLRSGNYHKAHRQTHNNQEKNERLTVKWLSSAVSEMKTELSEIQTTLNSTVILQNHEEIDSELNLLKTDITNLNKELEGAKSKNAKYEADLAEMREEVGSLRDHCRATAVTCGKTKNQLKAAQLEWNFNWKKLNEKKGIPDIPLEEETQVRPSRHQRLLKKHVIDLEKTTKHLRHANEELQTKILKLEEEMRILQRTSAGGNDVENHLQLQNLNEIGAAKDPSLINYVNLEEKFLQLEKQQRNNADLMYNFTHQLLNFDKLHMSMLELLENVESIENKVDKNFPEFRKEISKLEFQMSEATSEISLLKEDQTNTRESVKAIGATVSNLQDKLDVEHSQFGELNRTVDGIKKSSNVQISKLHDHILKTESSTVDLNSTKSTIHLVQELKSFEHEYKSIVNKLPHDCNAVAGPNGIYLISPGDGEPIMANCEDGWTTIQKRYDGSVNFNRNWNEYSNGFGSATGEHWLGNRNINFLTGNNCTKLEIKMKDIYGKYWRAVYDDFRVGDYSAGFKLVVDKYSGNASDALDYQNRMEFSTVDNDRDISNTHCASNYEGGWWFSHCQHANLNGRYNLGLTWFDSKRNEWIAVATSEMRIKRRENC